MFDLFRQELETQITILNNGLLALESNSYSPPEIEALMRAAHSIKGAARMVDLNGLVNLAHAMEDCFIAAQNQTLTLSVEQVDILFQGVDFLASLTEVNEADLPQWLAENESKNESIYQEINSITSGATTAITASPPGEVTTTKQKDRENQELTPSSTTLTVEPTISPDRVVRVSAENLNRIMGLAGESLIEANWLQPFADSLIRLRNHQVELARILENLQTNLAHSSEDFENQKLVEVARRKEQECREFLGERLDELELHARRTANLSDRLYREVIASNMRPFADGVQGFPRMIRDLARQLQKQVRLEIIGNSTTVDRDILKKLEAPLTHILRNAIDHGIEMPEERIAAGKSREGTVRLEAFHRGGMLAITISDDGRGINFEQVRQTVIRQNLAAPDMAAKLTEAELIEFLFLPGFSTTNTVSEISGRGVGLDVVKSMVQEVGGTIRANSLLGKGTSFYFQLPLTLSVVRTLIVEISGEPYAFPLARVDQIVRVNCSEIALIENRQYFTKDGKNIGLVAANQILNLPAKFWDRDALPVVVISEQSSVYGLVVDKFLGERDLVVRPLDPRLGKIRDISASGLMDDGSPVLIVDVSDLVRSIDTLLESERINQVVVEKSATRETQKRYKRILVVDDSPTVREMQKKLLQNQGYEVDLAVNGMDAWNALKTKDYNLVVSDIDMPRMSGIELVKQIKSHSRLSSIPVIIVSYRDREDDRIQGLEAGADYYLTKSSFQDNTLIDAVIDLIGNAG